MEWIRLEPSFKAISFTGVFQPELKRWCDEQLVLIHSRCVEGGGGCLLWTGAATGKGKDNRYGVKAVTNIELGLKNKSISVHRLVYLFKHYDTRILHSKENKLEVSHLCHTTLCANSDHLTLETRSINAERRTCNLMRHCTKAHVPFCLFQ